MSECNHKNKPNFLLPTLFSFIRAVNSITRFVSTPGFLNYVEEAFQRKQNNPRCKYLSQLQPENCFY